MTLIINGETKEFDDSSTLQNIITNLQIENKVMAAAVNMNIVKNTLLQKVKLPFHIRIL